MKDARKAKFSKELGKNLNKIRKEKGLSFRELAAIAGLEHAQIARIEDGKVNPTLSTICSLAEALGVSAASLLNGM